MSFRKQPRLTASSLPARRTNALKSTGPRTECGKARVALNALKHGQRAMGSRRRLAWAGYREREALYGRIAGGQRAGLEKAASSRRTPKKRLRRGRLGRLAERD